MTTQLNMREMRLADLHPAEYNPRVELRPGDSEYEKIRRSIEEFGYVDPIIANADGTIIGGHQRYNVLRDLGYETAQVVIVDVDKAREKALNLALNKITGAWDDERVYELLVELDLSDIDMQLSGFDPDELETLAVTFGEQATDDGFSPEEAEQKARERSVDRPERGTIWRLGEHRLMCGDCLSPEDWAKLTEGAAADLVITDPPYNVDYTSKDAHLGQFRTPNGYRTQSTISNDKLEAEAFYAFLKKSFTNLQQMLRPGGAVYVFHADYHGRAFRNAFYEAGLRYSQCLIWEKNQFILGRADYQWRHEPILYGWKEGAPHYFTCDRTQDSVLLEDDIDFRAMKKPELIAFIEEIRAAYASATTVLYEPHPISSDLHPTMKPVTLVGRLIANSSRRGDLVIDGFGGSGTTMIAAEQLGRRAYLMELDPVYCDVIVQRWEQYTGREAERIG